MFGKKHSRRNISVRSRSAEICNIEKLEGRVLLTVSQLLLLQDDFSQNSLNTEKWTPKLSDRTRHAAAMLAGEQLKLSGNSLAATANEYIPTKNQPIIIQGTWTPVAGHFESLIVNTRTKGELDPRWGNATDGIKFHANTKGLFIINDLHIGKRIAEGSISLQMGKAYFFEIKDDGEFLEFRIFDDVNGTVDGTLKATSTSIGEKSYISFSDEGTEGYANYDDISIRTLREEDAKKETKETTTTDSAFAGTELLEEITLIDKEIEKRGKNATTILRSFTEEFDTWNSSWSKAKGSPTISNGSLHLGGNSVAQMQNFLERQDGRTRTNTMHVSMGSSERFMWMPFATSENIYGDQSVDIITGKYIAIGDTTINGNIPGGTFTIVEVENDKGITITVTDSRGKTYNGSIKAPISATPRMPSLYGWKNVAVRDFSTEITANETLAQQRASLQAQIDAYQKETEEKSVVDSALEDSEFLDVLTEIVTREATKTTQQQINDLTLSKTDHKILIARQEQYIADAQQERAIATEVLERFADQEDQERLRITPSIRIEATRFRWDFQLHYSDMPEGYRVQFANQTIAIPEGSGKIIIANLPRPDGTIGYELNIIDSNGEKVTRVNVVKIAGGKISRTGAMNHKTPLPQISYIPEMPEDQRVSIEEKTKADQMHADATSNIKNAQTEIDRLQGELDTIIGQINALERSKIPYARMHVTPDESRSGFSVQYMNNHPQAYFEVFLQGEPGFIYRRTIEHAAGETNGLTSFDIRRSHGGNGNGRVEIRMYTDSSKKELLDTFKGHYNRNRNNPVSGETNAKWSEIQAGFPIYRTSTGETLEQFMDGQTTPLRIQTWNTKDTISDLSVNTSTNATEYLLYGTLSSLDFSSMEGSAAMFYANVQIEGDSPVTARFFRGGKEIASQIVNGEEPLQFHDDNGFSAVLFESINPVTLRLSDLNCLMNDAFDFDVSPLSGAENSTIANAMAKDWGNVDKLLLYPRFENFLGDNGIVNYRANGMSGPSKGQYYLLGYGDKEAEGGGRYAQYTLYTPESTISSPTLGRVKYFNDDGIHDLSPAYYTLDNGAIIMHPGAPTAIAVEIAEGRNVRVGQRDTSSNIDDLLQRKEDFAPDISVQKLYRGHHSDPGFHDGITEIQDGETPVLSAGEQFHALLTLNNTTGISDTVTIEAYVSLDESNERTHVGTFTITMGAYRSATLIVNATAPTSGEGRPTLSFEVNGELVAGKHGRKEGRMTAEQREKVLKEKRQHYAKITDQLVIERYGAGSEQHLATRAHLIETLGVAFDPITAKKQEETVTTNTQDQDAEKIIQQTIRDRVTKRLQERLAAMSITERAEARGLLRLQADGKLDEYFDELVEKKNEREITLGLMEVAKKHKKYLEESKASLLKEKDEFVKNLTDLRKTFKDTEKTGSIIGILINVPTSILGFAKKADSIENLTDMLRLFVFNVNPIKPAVVQSNIQNVVSATLDENGYFDIDADDHIASAWAKVSIKSFLSATDPGYYLENLVFRSYHEQIDYALHFFETTTQKRLEQYDKWISSTQKTIDHLNRTP